MHSLDTNKRSQKEVWSIYLKDVLKTCLARTKVTNKEVHHNNRIIKSIGIYKDIQVNQHKLVDSSELTIMDSRIDRSNQIKSFL